MTAQNVEGLYAALKHGDDEHKMWLYEAIRAYYMQTPIPPARGSGNREQKIKELETEVKRLKTELDNYENLP